MPTCSVCKEPGKYSVLLGGDIDRLYLPNQNARDVNRDINEVWFCAPCMRTIEDNLRATVLYLQQEGGAAWANTK